MFYNRYKLSLSSGEGKRNMAQRDKKLVERPENEPPFDRKNPTDRKILRLILLIALVVTVIAAGLFLLYYFVIQ